MQSIVTIDEDYWELNGKIRAQVELESAVFGAFCLTDDEHQDGPIAWTASFAQLLRKNLVRLLLSKRLNIRCSTRTPPLWVRRAQVILLC